MSSIHILDQNKNKLYNEHGEVVDAPWQVIFKCGCVEHYPKSRQGVTGDIKIVENVEMIENYEIVYIDLCECPCYDICDADIKVGQFAYLSNKIWKVISSSIDDDCGCYTIKLILDRLQPRENYRHLVECVECFETEGCNG